MPSLQEFKKFIREFNGTTILLFSQIKQITLDTTTYNFKLNFNHPNNNPPKILLKKSSEKYAQSNTRDFDFNFSKANPCQKFTEPF